MLAAFALSLSGCAGLREYVHNGFKVGPNYRGACGNTAENWIEEADERVRQEAGDCSYWWSVFQDPVLDGLIARRSLKTFLSVKPVIACCKPAPSWNRPRQLVSASHMRREATGVWGHRRASEPDHCRPRSG